MQTHAAQPFTHVLSCCIVWIGWGGLSSPLGEAGCLHGLKPQPKGGSSPAPEPGNPCTKSLPVNCVSFNTLHSMYLSLQMSEKVLTLPFGSLHGLKPQSKGGTSPAPKPGNPCTKSISANAMMFNNLHIMSLCRQMAQKVLVLPSGSWGTKV